MLLGLLLLACQPETRSRRAVPPEAPTDTTLGPTEPDDSVECGPLPPMPAAGQPLSVFVPGEYAAVHEDFTFTPEGQLVGVHAHDGVLQAADIDGLVTPLVPGFERGTKGITRLPDGRLAIADPSVGAVRIVDPATGSQEIVGGGWTNPNGIMNGPDGDLFVTTFDGVFRVDLAGTVEVIAEGRGLDLDGIAFSPDFATMYVDRPSGSVFVSTQRPDGSWTPPEPFASVPIARDLVYDVADGMVTDVCGNLYVVGMRGSLLRFAPDGRLDGVTTLEGAEYELFTAVRFGPGAGGFDAHTAYVTGLHGTVLAVPLGVGGTPR